MKQKMLALALALVLTCSLAVPAAAAQAADERLSAVTVQVKKTLGLDTEEYTEFYGELEEGLLAPSWYLEWNSGEKNLVVTATEEGKILSYYFSDNRSESQSDRFAPAFPAGSRDAARAAAQDFLNQILTSGESLLIEDRGADQLNTTVYRFRGEILLNGLSAGLTYSISVRCEDNQVLSFYRDDLSSSVMGGVPSAAPAVLSDTAGNALKTTLSLRLEYVLEEDGGTRAVLRYLPDSGDAYYVDASTGSLVNLTELAQKAYSLENGRVESPSASADAEESAGGSLSGAEQSGAAKLEGVLSREALDAAARGISALGLSRYTLSTVNYVVPREDGEEQDGAVTAILRYGRQVNDTSWRRTVTLDAKTGELLEVSSSARMPEETVRRTVNADAAQKTAEAFLQAQCPDQFARTAEYDSTDALETARGISHSFTYAQKENGYFFPDNQLRVSVDATDGSISGYDRQFDDAVTFDSPDGILTAEQALDAWMDTYTVELQYVQVPTAVDYSKPEYAPLQDAGVAYLYRLVLGYQLERESYLAGIDAKTGAPVEPGWAEEDGISYSDLGGHWARGKIEALARYGVGYDGGTFRPEQVLTQLDLVALLVSTDGYLYNAGEEGAADRLYEIAYDLGILRREDRNDAAVLTRSTAVRMILDAMGYGPIAQLEGIFRTGFTDESSILAGDLGYAALAQGLGMVSGDRAGRFLPASNATRAQAAVMLYNLMAR